MTSHQIVVNGVDIPELLVNCQNPQRRAEAERQLEVLQTSYPFQLFPALAVILASDDKPAVARQLAGLVLKNAFGGAKQGAREKQCRERWMAVSQAGEPGSVIKRAVLSALTQSRDAVARRTAAQVVSAIAAIELPLGMWSDLVDPVLITSMTPDKDVLTKQSALVCLSYVSEELSSRDLEIPQSQINSILTAIIQGMKDSEDGVKKEAAKALYFALTLARSNFENQPERDVIMSTVCDAANFGLSPSASRAQVEVCAAACECLVQIATEYYQHLSQYMNTVGPLTWKLAQQTQHENLAMCAIEFWSTICDEENYLTECVLQDGADSVPHPSAGLAGQALRFLLPILAEVMSRPREDEDEDDDDSWNSSMSAGTCLSLLAQATRDDCVDGVMQFVNANYNAASASQREAAMLAYGSVMDGPSTAKLAPVIQMSLSVIVEALNDPTVGVRDNAAWTIGRICQFHSAAIGPAIPNLVPILLARLAGDKPRVAANVAWTFDVLGQNQGELSSPLFTQIVGGLLNACTRSDANVRNLRMAGYAAVSSLASNAGKESGDALLALLDELTARLETSIAAYGPMLQIPQQQALSDEMKSAVAALPQADRDCELQGHICGCMQVVMNRLRNVADLTSRAERLMTLFMHVFQLYRRMQGSAASAVHEETLLATSALAAHLGAKFSHFAPVFFPVLLAALGNPDAVNVCSMSIGVVGDLARALDKDIAPFLDQLVRDTLAPLLERKDVDRTLKPLVMTALGDLALATRAQFEPYVLGACKLLSQAAYTRLEDGPVDSEEWIDYLNQLRASVLDAYTGLVHGLREANRHGVLKDSVQGILEFVVRLIEDKSVSEDVLRSAMGLVGDLVISFQADLARLIKGAPFLQRLISYSSASKDTSIQETGKWLARTVEKYNA